MSEIEGVIVKGIGGFYYVNCRCGQLECRARGLLRKQGITPLVGDRVICRTEDLKTGFVWEILERQNVLIRPAVANVSLMVLVAALESPTPNPYIIDKLLASAHFAGLKAVICFNKSDLCDDLSLAETYKKAGYTVLITSALENENIDKLKAVLKDEITVFAGNSGVGKSSLLNCIFDDERFETGTVSDKTERGRHTTRHSQLEALPFGGYIIDTPGFSSFSLETVSLERLADLFPEFKDHRGKCRFLDCSHTKEDDCGISEAVKNGEIPESRYKSYTQLYEEIKQLQGGYKNEGN